MIYFKNDVLTKFVEGQVKACVMNRVFYGTI